MSEPINVDLIIEKPVSIAHIYIKRANLDTLREAHRIESNRFDRRRRVTLIKLLEAEIGRREKRGES